MEDCPICGGSMRPFFESLGVPVSSCTLFRSPEEARSIPRGDIVLGLCAACGFIRNVRFDPELTRYSASYEETQSYSPTFRRFDSGLAADLVDRHGLRGKRLLEIGCGKGEFLAQLCRIGPNEGIGYDPAFDPDRGVLAELPGVTVVRDFYTEEDADQQADFVCCKMTLEHIADPLPFVRAAIEGATNQGVLYVQVPDAERILVDCAFEDIYYEHCSYFTSASLASLFTLAGLDVLRLESYYSGQYLGIEGRRREDDGASRTSAEGEDTPQHEGTDEVERRAEAFGATYRDKARAWRSELRTRAEAGSVVLWGSGSKAVAFLCAVDPDGVVDRVVDINPHRHGCFMPGSGQPIVGPSELTARPPATVIVMNPVYRAEIRADLESAGLHPTVLTL